MILQFARVTSKKNHIFKSDNVSCHLITPALTFIPHSLFRSSVNYEVLLNASLVTTVN